MYEVEWQRDTSVGCTDEDTGSTTITGGSMTSYTITGLEEDSRYAVTVNASNSLGDETSNHITAMTMVAAPLNTSNVTVTSTTLLHHHCPVGGGAMYPSEWSHHRLLSPVWSDGEWEHTDVDC
ncbi:hypothetical protein GBAR_LOCUS24034 [Geodia barretti]|uniref:Fibronectin type-III domain-containing protein n=1 Tax=Geodia barretti TaxID=519541 RepID=A0AA35X2V2_GEOBA|nr:hypothetical protein GBAR_LOCUS24034 [Geodia barretti]